jgi:prevent-host-death family protein
MKTFAISEFKARALRIIDQVAANNESIIITKRGKPLAQIIPFRESNDSHKPGQLADSLVFEKDIITPIGEDIWEASK